MLTAVEDDDGLSFLKMAFYDVLKIFKLPYYTDGERKCFDDQARFAQQPQINKCDISGERECELFDDRKRDGGFADASGSHYRNEALLQQRRGHLAYGVVSTDHPPRKGRPQRTIVSGHTRRSPDARNWHHKAVAPPGNVGNVADVLFVIAQRFAQRHHVNAQIDLVDKRVGPHLLD